MTWYPARFAEPTSCLIRAEVVTYAAPVDEFDNPIGTGRQELVYRRFPILSYTPCGAWIDTFGDRRFVNLRARKQYACGTEADALSALRARKERQIAILSAQLRSATRALKMLDASQ